MSPLPTIADICPISTPDRTVLRSIEDLLEEYPIIDCIEWIPDFHEPQLIRAHIAVELVSSPDHSAQLEFRWFSSSFSIRYIETRPGDEEWWCQWDSHPNPDTSVVYNPIPANFDIPILSPTPIHFHHPPDGSFVEPLSLNIQHPIGVALTVLASIEKRLILE